MAGFGTSLTSRDVRLESAKWAEADIGQVAATNRNFNEQVRGWLTTDRGDGHHDGLVLCAI